MRILIIGAAGRLGAALVREYQDKFDVTGFNHAQVDLSNFDQVREKLDSANFDVLINVAAFTKVDLCEVQPEEAFHVNAEAPRLLAEICRDKNARLIHFSTDYVFDGEKREPYTEKDEAKPISVYGASKLAGEANVLAAGGDHLIVRVSWVFGPDRTSFIDAMIKHAQENEKVEAIADKFSAPTYTLDIAQMLPCFFNSNADGGILHFANVGECSWQQYAQWALDCCHRLGVSLKARMVRARKLNDMANWIARRPVYSVLSTVKYAKLSGISPRAWREAVADYIKRFYSAK